MCSDGLSLVMIFFSLVYDTRYGMVHGIGTWYDAVWYGKVVMVYFSVVYHAISWYTVRCSMVG